MPSDSHKREKKDRHEDRHRSRKHSKKYSRDKDDRSVSDDSMKRHKKSHSSSHRASDDRKRKRSRSSSKRERRDRSLSDDRSENSRERRRKSKKASSRSDDRKRHKESKSKSSRKSSKDSKPQVDLSSLFYMGGKKGAPPSRKLDPENDYFAFHDHLRLFLYRTEGVFFEDLSSTKTHKAFASFCSKYNAGELEEAYYLDELPEDALNQCKRTKHSWNFKTSSAEIKSLDLIKNGVKKQTSYDIKPPAQSKQPTATLCVPVADRPAVKPRNETFDRERAAMSSSSSENKNKMQTQEEILKSLGLGLKAGQKIRIAPRER